jgi:citrate synthase
MLHEQLISFFRGFKSDAHPMAILVGVTGALSAFFNNDLDINDHKQREMACTRLIAKMVSKEACVCGTILV